MAPKHQRIAISKAETHRTPPNYLVAGYQAIVSPNNANIVRSVAMFGSSAILCPRLVILILKFLNCG
ncbi:component of translocase of the outer mitochondrial membrane complex [Golovinomyces cichoracearum]|uniref:Component of translocase of the outer mitochondrial membrane complex n=1 Tax=Golovinomyces cichoracearum TaxID=62708 RepID=A0A420IG21_9PEZI|nr:component of translocase of the outer mitochondrial membrane complex [Golovinomyces cichoracearum]